jgi:hypothetical protein
MQRVARGGGQVKVVKPGCLGCAEAVCDECEPIEYEWHSTPRLWAAYRHGYDGAPNAGTAGRMGFGKTKETAAADLIERESQ